MFLPDFCPSIKVNPHHQERHSKIEQCAGDVLWQAMLVAAKNLGIVSAFEQKAHIEAYFGRRLTGDDAHSYRVAIEKALHVSTDAQLDRLHDVLETIGRLTD